MTALLRVAATGLIATLLIACGQGTAPPTGVDSTPPMEPANAGSKDFGNYTLQFAAITTDTLTPEIAKSYNIQRSPNRAMLNVSILKQEPGTPGVPVAGKVETKAVNLTGQFKDLTVREIRDGAAIYYIGDVAVADDETLVFTVKATPEGETTPMAVRFQRQYFGG